MPIERRNYVLYLAAFAFGSLSLQAVQPLKEITLPGTLVYPESITSTTDGTLIVGSLGKRNVSRIAPGTTDVKEWIKPGTDGLNQVFGVFADDKFNTLWVCSDRVNGATGDDPALMAFDLRTGQPKGRYPLPDANAFCNDIATTDEGTAYISDTHEAAVYMLKPGAKQFETVAKDPLLEGADGIAFGEKHVLYVTGVTTGKLLRLNLGPDGKSTGITDLKPSRTLTRPDGMRTLGKDRLILAENGGRVDIITFSGPGGVNAEIRTIKEDIDGASAVTATHGIAWVAEGKLKYWEDPNFMGKDPGLFPTIAVPLPSK